jgi:hypothetical protein
MRALDPINRTNSASCSQEFLLGTSVSSSEGYGKLPGFAAKLPPLTGCFRLESDFEIAPNPFKEKQLAPVVP